jgi:hypothetical protein
MEASCHRLAFQNLPRLRHTDLDLLRAQHLELALKHEEELEITVFAVLQERQE